MKASIVAHAKRVASTPLPRTSRCELQQIPLKGLALEGANQEQYSHVFDNVADMLLANNTRGVRNFANPKGVQTAVNALASAKNIALLTGFNVAENMPETDGPPGLAALADALIKVGKKVTFVTDTLNQAVVKNALRVINPEAAKYCRFIAMDEGDGPQAKEKAEKILKDNFVDTVVAGELAGRGAGRLH